MAGLFGGLRRGLNSANQPGGFTDRLAMFGAQMQDIGGGGGSRAASVQQQIANRQQQAVALQALRDQTALEDRLRAALSPADGPNGSGTGAAPGLQQQMAALDEARLLNPEVADRFAPYVQGQQDRQQASALFANDPRAQALWASGLPEFRKAQAEQYAPQVVQAGGAQVVNGRRTVEQPTYAESGDTTLRRDSSGVAPVFTRTTPSISEQTARLAVERPQLANVSPGQEVYGVGPQGQVSPLARSTQERPISVSDQNALDEADRNLTRLNTSIGRAQQIMEQIQGGQLNLGPVANTLSGLRNRFGQSDANSLNYDALLAWAKEARNAALSANTGVQTDQDAIRELDTIISNISDERVVSAALARYIDKNNQTVQSIQRGVDRRLGGREQSGGVVTVSGPEEARLLPRGTRFRTPDGRVMVVQ